eukprot:840075-Pyramimonas_sp.AAC.1
MQWQAARGRAAMVMDHAQTTAWSQPPMNAAKSNLAFEDAICLHNTTRALANPEVCAAARGSCAEEFAKAVMT